jgi:hypothetical protein
MYTWRITQHQVCVSGGRGGKEEGVRGEEVSGNHRARGTCRDLGYMHTWRIATAGVCLCVCVCVLKTTNTAGVCVYRCTTGRVHAIHAQAKAAGMCLVCGGERRGEGRVAVLVPMCVIAWPVSSAC